MKIKLFGEGITKVVAYRDVKNRTKEVADPHNFKVVEVKPAKRKVQKSVRIPDAVMEM